MDIDTILAFALVVVTWIYVFHTKRMADVMYQDYKLRVTPLADIKIMINQTAKPHIKFTVSVTNKGYCRIRMTSGQWLWWSKLDPGSKRIRHTFSPPKYQWISEGQQVCFETQELFVSPEYWEKAGFNPSMHISIDGWVDIEGPTGIVERYLVRTNL